MARIYTIHLRNSELFARFPTPVVGSWLILRALKDDFRLLGEKHMSALTIFLGFSLLATPALAEELVANPTHIGFRSNNPEQETYGTRVDSATFTRALAFAGPPRNVGPVTGEPEKDTIGYRVLFVDLDVCKPSAHASNVEFNIEAP